jgi:hypothetical protein
MGTRADFYVGRGEAAEWLGSVAYDGDPSGWASGDAGVELTICQDEPHPDSILEAKTSGQYVRRVAAMLAVCHHATLPAQGWPWPWETSHTTDYAYCWDAGEVLTFCLGRLVVEGETYDQRHERPLEPFPDMTKRQNVTFGERSGLLLLTAEPPPKDGRG